MQMPNTTAGRITEQIMAGVRKRLPDIKTHEYNRIYESCLEVLNNEEDIASNKNDVPQFKFMM